MQNPYSASIASAANELVAEVEVAANTFAAEAIEAEYGFCMLQIGFVFHAAVAGVAAGIKVLEVHSERFQFGEFLGQGDGTIYTLGFQQTVFDSWIWLLDMHQLFKLNSGEAGAFLKRPLSSRVQE